MVIVVPPSRVSDRTIRSPPTVRTTCSPVCGHWSPLQEDLRPQHEGPRPSRRGRGPPGAALAGV